MIDMFADGIESALGSEAEAPAETLLRLQRLQSEVGSLEAFDSRLLHVSREIQQGMMALQTLFLSAEISAAGSPEGPTSSNAAAILAEIEAIFPDAAAELARAHELQERKEAKGNISLSALANLPDGESGWEPDGGGDEDSGDGDPKDEDGITISNPRMTVQGLMSLPSLGVRGLFALASLSLVGTNNSDDRSAGGTLTNVGEPQTLISTESDQPARLTSAQLTFAQFADMTTAPLTTALEFLSAGYQAPSPPKRLLPSIGNYQDNNAGMDPAALLLPTTAGCIAYSCVVLKAFFKTF